MFSEDTFLTAIARQDAWDIFFNHKITYQHINTYEENQILPFINQKCYLTFLSSISDGTFPNEYPTKKIVNKEGASKKRIVYSFSEKTNIMLKFMAFYLYKYDSLLSPNCYAFRRNYGVGYAIRRIKSDASFQHKYCYKADITNYFNSIDIQLLLPKLSFLQKDDPGLYRILEHILTETKVTYQNQTITDSHGAMAGIPISPFFANWYLKEVDDFFLERDIAYFRYSDDILIFADSYEELISYKEMLLELLKQHRLTLNHSKEHITKPGEAWEFLGFSYHYGTFDLSAPTKRKIKAKIKRKADALRRWQRKKKLPPDKAAIGFIRAMNYKFYGDDTSDDFCWKRWFFPYLDTTAGLKEIDAYMQEYIRYAVTGRHYKGNYRISYQQLKEWGYRSLVHEFYNRNDKPINTAR